MDNRFTLYLPPTERARLVALGSSLERHGYTIKGPNNEPSKAAVVRALMQYLYDNMPDDEQRRVDAEARAIAQMYADVAPAARDVARGARDGTRERGRR